LEKNTKGNEPSCLVLPTCLHKNINQFKVKLKSIYQNLIETTDTNNYFWSVDLYVSEMSSPFFSFLSLSVSLSTSFVPTRSAYLDYNLHVAMFDNDNVVTDEVKIINK
jgi:hypothetical protein